MFVCPRITDNPVFAAEDPVVLCHGVTGLRTCRLHSQGYDSIDGRRYVHSKRREAITQTGLNNPGHLLPEYEYRFGTNKILPLCVISS